MYIGQRGRLLGFQHSTLLGYELVGADCFSLVTLSPLCVTILPPKHNLLTADPLWLLQEGSWCRGKAMEAQVEVHSQGKQPRAFLPMSGPPWGGVTYCVPPN